MDRAEFESIAQEVFDSLPEAFRHNIENVHIVVEEIPGQHTMHRAGGRSGSLLLGLYEGIPLNKRGTAYGMFPAIPDKITLYKGNIEAVASGDDQVRAMIRDVLIHEIAHYFGMNEEEVRNAGY